MSERSKRDRDIHVVGEKGPGRGWLVVYQGLYLFATFPKQIDAVRYARGTAIEKRCELVIHGKDGKIRRKVSYGADSKKRKG